MRYKSLHEGIDGTPPRQVPKDEKLSVTRTPAILGVSLETLVGGLPVRRSVVASSSVRTVARADPELTMKRRENRRILDWSHLALSLLSGSGPQRCRPRLGRD